MLSRPPRIPVGPLVVDGRLTTYDLGAIDADEKARGRADDDGMPIPEPSTPAPSPETADLLLDELDQLSTRGGERHAVSLGRFGQNVAKLRALAEISGADRVRAFIRGDLRDARRLRRPPPFDVQQHFDTAVRMLDGPGRTLLSGMVK